MEITSSQPIQISPCRKDFYLNSTSKSLITSPHPRLDSCTHQRKRLRLATVRKSSNPGTLKSNSAHRLRSSCLYEKRLPMFQPSAKQSSSAPGSSCQTKSPSASDVCCGKSASSVSQVPPPGGPRALPGDYCAGQPTSNDCSHFTPATCSYSAIIPRMSPAAIRSISVSQQSALSSVATPLAYRLLYGSWEDDLPFIDLDEAK